MKFLEITGNGPLNGEVGISGAKNAVLPILMATILTSEECTITNVPRLLDVNLTINLLEHLGATVNYNNGKITTQIKTLASTEASYSLVKAMRASFWILGPLLVRAGSAMVAMPGGDAIGARPVDLHLAGLAAMGADIKVKHGVVYADSPNGLHPTNFEMRFPSVGATHQLMMTAACIPGTTVLRGTAREPEVVALANFINSMGGDIEGAGTSEIVIHGKKELHGGSANIIGDRIEAGTFLLAAAITQGKLKVKGFNPSDFGAFTNILQECGLNLEFGKDFVTVHPSAPLKPVHITTAPFPGFATDLQALIMPFLTQVEGESSIEESIFEGRFGHVSELCRMSANITVSDRTAIIRGKQKLTAAPVEAYDIRAAASLVLAALAAEGTSQLYGIQHLERGYSDFITKLRSIGAKVGTRVADPDDYLFTGC